LDPEKTSGGTGARLFLSYLLKLGCAEEQIAAECRFDPTVLRDPDAKQSLEDVDRLVRFASHYAGDPALALKLPQLQPAGRPRGLLGHLVVTADNLLEGFELWSRYLPIDNRQLTIVVTREGDLTKLTGRNLTQVRAIWITELFLSIALYYAHSVTGKQIKPVQVDVVHAPVPWIDAYVDLCGVRPDFRSKDNVITFKTEDLLVSNANANPMIKALLSRQADEMLAEQYQGIIGLVKREIERVLGTTIAKTVVAKACGMSGSTLSRKLAEQNTSYAVLLDEVRKSMAGKFINTRMKSLEMSQLLGYKHSSSLNHAFKRWFQDTPNTIRTDRAKIDSR
jgi:AraC-like DNA-binding protein